MKNIVITGASSGIGYATALSLSKNSEHRVFALARNSALLKSLAAKAPAGNVVPFVFDILAGKTLLETIDGTLKGADIDILINNAGHLVNKPFAETGAEEWKATFDVNFFGTVNVIRSVLPLMGRGDRGHIVNIGSMGGVEGSIKFPGLTAYSASKAALANLTETLAQELVQKNIAINCLAFGAVQTEMLGKAFPGYQAPVSANETGIFVGHFALTGATFFNGKIIHVSSSTP
jgi:NAD(P)-dependent dehydrogenase (short-subunit alcohol dehydrogenase family)